jgi:hypothetical protein
MEDFVVAEEIPEMMPSQVCVGIHLGCRVHLWLAGEMVGEMG